jgi:hypothetical protein
MLGPKRVERVDNGVECGDLRLLALELSPELRILAESALQAAVVMTGIELCLRRI